MDSIANELKKLEGLLNAGTLNEQEFQEAKEVLLRDESGGTVAATSATEQELAKLRLETELLRIDQQWQDEQRRHYARFGSDPVPTRPTGCKMAASVVIGLVAFAFGTAWITLTLNVDSPGPVPLFGLVLLIIGIAVPVYYGTKYSAYNRAYQRYGHRRAEVVARLEETTAGGGEADQREPP